jgi:cell division inhibitor SepF
MAGAMRKMGIYLGLVEDNADDQAEEYGDYRESREYESYPDYSDEYESESAAAPRRETASRTWAESTPTPTRTAVVERPSYTESSYRSGAYAAAVRNESVNVPNPVRETVSEPDLARSALSQIVTLHPRTYNEARVIGEHFRDSTPVIMNLTEMDDADAKRLVDFAAGLTFGLRGSIDRVTNRVFLLSPQNINVTAEDKARLAEGGFFNQS